MTIGETKSEPKVWFVTSWANELGAPRLRPEWRETRTSAKAAWKVVDDCGAKRKYVERNASADGQVVYLDIIPAGQKGVAR